MQLNCQNVKWLGRMALILVLVALADGVFVYFARKPLPYAAIIPGLIPLLTSLFVIIPMMRAQKQSPPSA